jgi:hypothetical protein
VSVVVRGCCRQLLPSAGSAEVRLLAVFQEVLEPESLGVVHRQLLDLFGRHEPEFGGLVGDLQLAAGDAGPCRSEDPSG